MPDDGEQVTFILPSGEKQAFLIPSGMSDAEAKTYVLSKRPDLFQPKIPSFMDAAMQAHQQAMRPLQQATEPFTGSPKAVAAQQMAQNTNKELGQNFSNAAVATGALAGGGMAGGAAAGMGRLVPALARIMGAGAGGATAGIATGESPTQVLATGAKTSIGAGIGEGVGAALSPLVKWIGASKTFGAKMLQQASAKAGNAPVELSPQTNEIVEEITKQGKLGGTVPKVISDLLERVGPSTRQAADAVPGPLTYDEARILQSNASDSSVNEKLDLKGKLRYLMPKFANSFSQDVQAAADQAGIGTEHALGMQEYATAAGRSNTMEKIGRAAKLAAKGALGVGAGAAAGYEVYRILKGQR